MSTDETSEQIEQPGGVARRNLTLKPALQAAEQEHQTDKVLTEAVKEGVKATAKAAKFKSHTQSLAARLQGDAITNREHVANVRKKIAELQEEEADLEAAHAAITAAMLSLQQAAGSDG